MTLVVWDWKSRPHFTDYLERCSNNKKQTLSSLKVNCKGTVAQMMSIVKLLFWYEKCAEKWWFTVRFFFLQVTTSKKNSPIRVQTSLSQFSKNKLLVFVFKLLLVFGCSNEAFSTTFRSGVDPTKLFFFANEEFFRFLLVSLTDLVSQRFIKETKTFKNVSVSVWTESMKWLFETPVWGAFS